MPSKRLTETFAARITAESRTYYWDTQIRGFGLRVASGRTPRRTWLIRYRSAEGKRRELKLGMWPILTANEARALALEHVRSVQTGGDPAKKRDDTRQINSFTVAMLADRFREVRMAKMSPKSTKTYEAMLHLHILDDGYGIGSLCVTEVRRADVQHLVDAVSEQRRKRDGLRMVAQAKKVKALVTTLYRFAEVEELVPPNTLPTRGVRVDDRRREWEIPLVEEIGYVFEPGESERVWKALNEVDVYDSAKDFIRLLMLTGVRSDEARLLTWQDVRLDGPEPHLAIRRHKTSRRVPVKKVPLPNLAVDLLRRRGPGTPGEPVFPSPRDSRKPLGDPFAPWKKVRDHAGLPKARIHDLRGLAACHLLDAGWSKEQVQVFMEWQSPQMVERYVRRSKQRRQEGAEVLARGVAGKASSPRP